MLIPLFIYLLAVPTLSTRIWALVVFAIASLTDILDGWSARKLNQESELGKFLDPLADKFLVISAFTAILILDPGMQIFDLWMLLIIVGRDVLLTIMRWLAIRRGASLKTSSFGKVKTAFQMISIVIILMIYIVRKTGYYTVMTHKSVPYWIMLFVTIMTLISGVRYLIENWKLFLPEKKNNEPQDAVKP